METKKPSLSWNNLFLITFLVAYLYTFNEWLFAITKPSYMNDLGFTQQLQVLVIVSALLASLCFLCLLPLVILSLIPPVKQYTYTLIQLSTWLPAVVFAALILIMVDNFTYTIFRFGIVLTEGWSRGLYGLSFILVIILCYRFILNALATPSRRTRTWWLAPKWIFSFLVSMILLSLAALVLTDRTKPLSFSVTNMTDAKSLPHVLLITADGVDAAHMSAYGYGRDTTPRIRQLAESALVAENAFSNAGNSAGSVISIYTGKYPAKTRVLYPPDILRGTDAYEHLPGILRSQGYKTVQITLPHYLDANQLNVLDGFDEVKMSNAEHSKYLNMILKAMPSDKALFIDEIIIRIVDRIGHVFFFNNMINPYILVIGRTESIEDVERMETLRQEIRTTKQPLFIHVHLMVTHGYIFNPQEQIFSAGQSIEDQEPWSNDFYDDSILDFDTNVGELVDYLTELGLLDNTILIIGSDHGPKGNPLKRVPLVIRFPYRQYAGQIQTNVQNLDIAPTLLDYIGLDQPDWMRGKSLIAGELEQKPIFEICERSAARFQSRTSTPSTRICPCDAS